MKNTMLLCALFIALTASMNIHAADTAELKVKGTVRPAACTLTLGGGGTVDYGHITNSQLSGSKPTKLPPKTIPYSVNCPNGGAIIGVMLTDNRKASVVKGMIISTEGDNFGLGTVNGKNLGVFIVGTNTTDLRIPGHDNPWAPYELSSINGGQSWWPRGYPVGSYPASLPPNVMRSWGLSSDYRPSAITSMSGILTVEAMLETIGNLPTGDNIPLDGSATMEMIYL